jgi:hypothetical protein
MTVRCAGQFVFTEHLRRGGPVFRAGRMSTPIGKPLTRARATAASGTRSERSLPADRISGLEGNGVRRAPGPGAVQKGDDDDDDGEGDGDEQTRAQTGATVVGE